MTYMLDTNICIYIMKQRPQKVIQKFREVADDGGVYFSDNIGGTRIRNEA